MINLIETLNYRCLKYVSRPLNSFHVLVGPNASGKTTFLDVVSFLGDFVSGGLDRALAARTQNFEDLIWNRMGSGFELAIEASIPEDLRGEVKNPSFDVVRYEVGLGLDEQTREVNIRSERVSLRQKSHPHFETTSSFPRTIDPPQTIIIKFNENPGIAVIKAKEDKVYEDHYWPESGDQTIAMFRLGPRKSALGNLPEDKLLFPVSVWLKRLLSDGVQSFVLNSAKIRNPSPPGQSKTFQTDGSNLPWVINTLLMESKNRFNQWIRHVRTALPDIESISTVLKDEDKHRYLVIHYQGGLKVPSWMVSDGTLRLLALTLPAYLPDFKGIYLIEEPENGIHPRAIETVFQSLSSVYNAQILLATHSPVILSVAEAKDVLCFSKNDGGATDIISGDHHPTLKDWKGQIDLGDLFASGVLS